MSKKKLIFIYPKLYTFIHTEIKLLSDEFELISITQNWESKILLPFNLIRQVVFLLINIRKVDIILISFGGYWSFLPAFFGNLLGKKVAIVVHGTDCVSFPEINYGNLRSPLMRYFTQKSYHWASIILPVSESLVYTENNYFSEKVLKFGYAHHLNNIKTPYKVIPNGLIINDWSRNTNISKEEGSFMTVLAPGKIVVKGADLIIKVAKSLPNCKFYFAGIDNIEKVELTDNVICLGRLNPLELKHWYSKTQFYLQLSNTEGFGVALCESMLCECVPIVSDVNFLPSIVGDSGFVLKRRNSDLLVKVIRSALKSELKHLEKESRKRIETKFSSDKRKEMLVLALNNY